VHEASVMQLVAPHPHVAGFLGTFRHRAPVPQSTSQSGAAAQATVPLADDPVNPLESMKKRPAPKVVHVGKASSSDAAGKEASGAESTERPQNEEERRPHTSANEGHSSSSSSISESSAVAAAASDAAADEGDAVSTTRSSRKTRASSSSSVSTGSNTGITGSTGSSGISSSSGKKEARVDATRPRRSKRNKYDSLNDEDQGAKQENEEGVLTEASVTVTTTAASQPSAPQKAVKSSATAPQPSPSLPPAEMQLPPHVVVASGSGLSLHTSLHDALPTATTNKTITGAEGTAEATNALANDEGIRATPANKRRRGGTNSAATSSSNASSASRSRSSPPPRTPRLSRSAAASFAIPSAAAAAAASGAGSNNAGQRADAEVPPPSSTDARSASAASTTAVARPPTASLPPPPWGDLELSDRPLVGGPRPLPAHLEEELQHSSLGVCVALAESDLDCVLTGTAGYGLAPLWGPDVSSATTPTMPAGDDVPLSEGSAVEKNSAQGAPYSSNSSSKKLEDARWTSKRTKAVMPLPRPEPDAAAAWKWRRPLPAVRAQRLFWQLLRALEGCHSRGVVHRNVKPAQLLVGRQPRQRYVPKPHRVGSGGGGIEKVRGGHELEGASDDDDDESDAGEDVEDDEVLQLCGFSHSIVLARGGTAEPVERTDAGTLWYRPPESLLGVRQVTCAADLWAAGAVWIEMLTGQPLFSSCTTEYGTLLGIFQLQGLPALDCPLRKAPLFDGAVFPHWPRAKCPAEGSGVAGLLGPLGCALLRGLLAYDPVNTQKSLDDVARFEFARASISLLLDILSSHSSYLLIHS